MTDATATPEAPDPAATGAYVPAANPPAPAEGPGTVLGRYTLAAALGEGGMGTVFRAEQTEPVRRTVALKVVKAGLDTAAVIARFEAERQALALMDHPNIAKVLDAGATATGRPYFVMELVEGVPLTAYCDRERLTVRQRLELLIPVCQAVQHAHQKGVIHRDLKPSNVLVAVQDGKPVPKVIDFGIAKATTQKLTERSLQTEMGQLVGTLEYMSPEQADLNPYDIDTRSDVYALGVLLYELLTGTTPLERHRLKAAALTEILRVIREEEPAKPSARLSGSDNLPGLSAVRRAEPRTLARQVAGDLEWVVMRCLEKDRARRYETANALALELQRYLADEPVSAGPPSGWYRLRKFVRRHRAGVAAAAGFVAVLAAATAVSLGLAWWALTERDRAAEAEGQARTAAALEREAKEGQTRAAAEATRQARFAQEVNAFLRQDLLGLIGVEAQLANQMPGDPDLKAKALLERAAQGLANGQRFQDQPLVEAVLRATVGQVYLDVGDAPRAVEHLERALTLFRAHPGAEPLDAINGLGCLAAVYQRLGQPHRALPLFEEALQRSQAQFGPDHPETLSCMNNLAYGCQVGGQLRRAQALYEAAAQGLQAKLGRDHPLTLACLFNLAVNYRHAGLPERALPLNEETCKHFKAKLGTDHPHTLTSMAGLAVAFWEAGQLDRARPLLEETHQRMQAKLGPGHPDTLACGSHLAGVYQSLGHPERARPLLEAAYQGLKAQLGPDHPETLTGLAKLASCLLAVGQGGRAVPLLEETLRQRQAKLGHDHPDTLSNQHNLAFTYQAVGQLTKALPLYEEALAGLGVQLGPDHPETLVCMNNLALAYQAGGQVPRALPLLEETRQRLLAKLGPDHPSTLINLASLALAYRAAGRLAQALPLLETVVQREQVILGPDHPDTLRNQDNLAVAYLDAHQPNRALALTLATLQRMREKLGPEHPDTLTCTSNLAAVYRALGQFDQAVPLLEAVVKRQAATLGRQHPDTLRSLANLGANYLAIGRRNEALPLLEEAFRAHPQYPELRWVGEPLLDGYLLAGETAKGVALVRARIASGRPLVPKDSPRLAAGLAQEGQALLKLRAWADAESVLRECLALREKLATDPKSGVVPWQVANARSLLGGALLGQGKHAEAEPLLIQGCEGLKAQERTIPPQGRANLPAALARLVRLYEATDCPQAAAPYRAELARRLTAELHRDLAWPLLWGWPRP